MGERSPSARAARLAGRLAERLLPPRLSIHTHVLWHWRYGEPELRLIGRLCEPAEGAVDVGASVGLYAYVLRRSAARCVCFEPNPGLAARLRRTFRDVRVEACALSDHDGEAELRMPRVAGVTYGGYGTIEAGNRHAALAAESYATVRVPVRRLDDFDLGPVGVVKIDVEGHELAVLRGAEGLLRARAPSLVVEAEDRHKTGAPAAVCGHLEARGYSGFVWLGGRLHPMAPPDVAAVAGGARDGLYINNFIYVKRPAVLDRLAPLIAALAG